MPREPVPCLASWSLRASLGKEKVEGFSMLEFCGPCDIVPIHSLSEVPSFSLHCSPDLTPSPKSHGKFGKILCSRVKRLNTDPNSVPNEIPHSLLPNCFVLLFLVYKIINTNIYIQSRILLLFKRIYLSLVCY